MMLIDSFKSYFQNLRPSRITAFLALLYLCTPIYGWGVLSGFPLNPWGVLVLFGILWLLAFHRGSRIPASLLLILVLL